MLAEQPRHGAALLALGAVWLGEGNEAEAELAFAGAVRAPETAGRANLELANLELRQRHYARSAGYLEAALRLERRPEVEQYLERVRALAEVETPGSP